MLHLISKIKYFSKFTGIFFIYLLIYNFYFSFYIVINSKPAIITLVVHNIIDLLNNTSY